MNLYLILFFMGIMVGILIGVQDITVSIYSAVLGVLKNRQTRKKNRGMF